MIDGVIRKAIEESIRFIAPGAVYACAVDDHRIVIVRVIADDGRTPEYFVACSDCLAVLSEREIGRRVYHVINNHTHPRSER